MVEKVVTVKNRAGIHARPAGMIVTLANKFESQIFIEKEDDKINAKSIMGVMMLAAGKGAVVTLEADGADERECFDALLELINNKFGEGE